MPDWPVVKYKEEGMREGMQIEDSQISVDDKVRLLDALSETGLKQIVVGSFVSPKWTPQMERIDEIVENVIAISKSEEISTAKAADRLAEERLRSVRGIRQVYRSR